MKLTGSRGVAAASRNPRCELRAAMVLRQVDEVAFYARHVGVPYPGDAADRVGALRYGLVFDRNLRDDGGAALLAALGDRLGVPPRSAVVRDLVREAPGTSPASLRRRWGLAGRILNDLAAGRPVPDVILQPPLALRLGPELRLVVPDALVRDPETGGYVPLEAKAHVAVPEPSPSARDGARRQAAVEWLALRGELTARGRPGLDAPAALLVFGSGFGLRPAPAARESVDAEVAAARAAVAALIAVAPRLAALERRVGPAEAFRRLPTHYRDACHGTCPLAIACRRRAAGSTRALGDAVARAYGPTTSVARAAALLDGVPPTDAAETALRAALQAAAERYELGPS